jgi:hypothetical protein
MDAWRASHAFPLNTFQISLRRHANAIDKGAIIAQRLKRAPSVISKLRRYDSMSLSRMQDLGGCRAIVSSVSDVFAIQDQFFSARHRHQLAGQKDYIAEPQDSGYRGVHLIYKYVSDRSLSFNGRRIELQLRTKVQHAWATAVEIAGVYVRTSLKSSIGPEDWLEFFRYASSLFSFLEGTPRLHAGLRETEIRERLLEINERISAVEKLENFAEAHRFLTEARRKADSHFILILDLDKQATFIEAFPGISPATERYAELEKQTIDDDTKDVVLVASESIEGVASAYPNYFVDTRQFLELLKRVL